MRFEEINKVEMKVCDPHSVLAGYWKTHYTLIVLNNTGGFGKKKSVEGRKRKRGSWTGMEILSLDVFLWSAFLLQKEISFNWINWSNLIICNLKNIWLFYEGI